MKSERMTVLVTPEVKASIKRRAEALNIPASELVRRAVETYVPKQDEKQLLLLAKELEEATKTTERKLDEALAAVNSTLSTIKARPKLPARAP